MSRNLFGCAHTKSTMTEKKNFFCCILKVIVFHSKLSRVESNCRHHNECSHNDDVFPTPNSSQLSQV